MGIRHTILLIFLTLVTHANIIITDQKSYQDFQVHYIYDSDSELTINDVVNKNFTQTLSSQFSLGYRGGTIWFKITLENRGDSSDFVLFFTEPFWEVFDLYRQTPHGWVADKNGLYTPLKEKSIEDAAPAFPLHIKPDHLQTYYIKAKTVNGIIGAFKLFTEKEFFRPSRLDLNTFYLFYSGVLFIIIILNIFLWIEMKERIYAYYIGYVSSFILFVSMFSGNYLYLGLPSWNQGLHTVGTIVLAFMALFSGTFLELNRYFPRVNTLFKTYIAVFLLCGVLIAIGIPYITLIFNILAFFMVTMLLVLAVKTWLRGDIKTRYYLIALIIYMPSMGLMALTFDGLLTNTDFSRYTFLLGALIEIVFFSLILATRFHDVKDEKIRIQNELLIEKHKNEQYLEQEIEKKRLELKEANEIMVRQSRHAAMGEMLSMIAHQWRQPLSTISAIASNLILKKHLDAYDCDNLHVDMESINQKVQHLSDTINDFRNFFNPNKEFASVYVDEIIRNLVTIVGHDLEQNNIRFSTEILSQSKLMVYPNELLQVLLNLVNNAKDALIEHAVIEPNIAIRAYDHEERFTCIEVYDNGGGIKANIIEHLFEPYFSTKGKNGTGLGLYIVKTIIEHHLKGTISVENKNEGASFIVTLPKAH